MANKHMRGMANIKYPSKGNQTHLVRKAVIKNNNNLGYGEMATLTYAGGNVK